MHKRTNFFLLIVGLSLLSLFAVAFVKAAPSEPADVVNHKTRECAKIWTGDECEVCGPTGDWELLKDACPEGYTQLNDFVANSCVFSGDAICCQNSPDLYPCPNSTANIVKNYVIVGSVLAIFLATVWVVLRQKKHARE